MQLIYPALSVRLAASSTLRAAASRLLLVSKLYSLRLAWLFLLYAEADLHILPFPVTLLTHVNTSHSFSLPLLEEMVLRQCKNKVLLPKAQVETN